jgi:hypothetical protein
MQNSRPYHPPALRKAILDMAFAGSTVHIGCAFSVVEILAVLHRDHLRYPGKCGSYARLLKYLGLDRATPPPVALR